MVKLSPVNEQESRKAPAMLGINTMKGRIVAALIIAPIATAITYAAQLYLMFRQMDPKPTNVDYIVTPFIIGVSFEVLILLPLVLVLRRFRINGFGKYLASAVFLWALFSFAIFASVMHIQDAAQTAVTTMVFGVVLVLVFGICAGNNAKQDG